MNTRLDADKIEIVTIDDVVKEYPNISVRLLDDIVERFSWDINDELVIAVEDLKFALKYHELFIFNKEDFEYEYMNKQVCSVCGEYLLSVDELYQDEVSGEVLCDKHSKFNEETNNYYGIDDNGNKLK